MNKMFMRLFKKFLFEQSISTTKRSTRLQVIEIDIPEEFPQLPNVIEKPIAYADLLVSSGFYKKNAKKY